MIPEDALRKLQDQLDIVQVIGAYLPSLKKAGRNFKALCPFHPEKTPSFMVYPEKQFFICYGCGAGGDLITFVMKHEKLEFTEAVELLAEKAGVELPRGPKGSGEKKEKSSLLIKAHECAVEFYHKILVSSPEAEAARAYLKKRSLTSATWEKLQLGFAPSSWDAFVTHAASKGLSGQTLEKAGLAAAREGKKEGWYDRFRARVLFPIWDARGRPIAFGGRVMEEAEGPKYLNSPETEIYIKGQVLYGLHLAAPEIRQKDFCIVVEGYMDMASPFQHGIGNIVASMGTALTPEQVKLIKRLTKHVVIVYDGDAAGQAATLRGLDLFLEAEMRIKVAVLPAGHDPDSLIRSKGVEAFAQVLKESLDLFEYKLGLLTRQFDKTKVEGRVGICQEMLPTIKRLPNAIARGEYVRSLSQILDVPEGLLWTELGRLRLAPGWKPTVLAEASVPKSQAISVEELLAGLIIEQPRRIELLSGRVDLSDFEIEPVRRLIEWIEERSRSGMLPEDYRQMLAQLPPGLSDEGQWAKWLGHADSVEDKERTLEELIQRMQSKRKRASLEQLRGSIAKAEAAGDDAQTTRLLSEYNRLMKEKSAV